MGFECEQDQFAPEELHGRTVIFTCVSSGSALDLYSGNGNDGTRVNGWSLNHSSPQQWKLEKVTPGAPWSAWTLRNVAGGSYLDLAGGNPDNCTPLQGWNTGGLAKSSQWYLITQDVSRRWYMLQNVATFTYVDLDGGNSGDGTRIQGYQRSPDLNPNQMWNIHFV
ncbi:ricin B lectin domain-containing protein [Aspergillus karnatakaensis]|uniref:ricin B lectin domain-containing protein n=1 Tax=Aspergillus karnatakaensis TaxID=1810916 RepID=UPI003CCE2A7E